MYAQERRPTRKKIQTNTKKKRRKNERFLFHRFVESKSRASACFDQASLSKYSTRVRIASMRSYSFRRYARWVKSDRIRDARSSQRNVSVLFERRDKYVTVQIERPGNAIRAEPKPVIRYDYLVERRVASRRETSK